MGGYRGIGDDQGIGGPYGGNPNNAVAAAMQHHAYYNPAAAMGGYGGESGV